MTSNAERSRCARHEAGPGEHGGEIVFFGPIAELAKAGGSLTADYLFHRKRVESPRSGTIGTAGVAAAGVGELQLKGAAEHNLKDIDGLRHRRQRLRQIHVGARRLISRVVARQGQVH